MYIGEHYFVLEGRKSYLYEPVFIVKIFCYVVNNILFSFCEWPNETMIQSFHEAWLFFQTVVLKQCYIITQSILIQFHWEVSHMHICNNCWSWPLDLNSITYQACSVECEEDTEDLAIAQLTSNHRLKSNLSNISISKENSLWAFGQVCFSIGGFE